MTATKYAVQATRDELIAAFIAWRQDPATEGSEEAWRDEPDEEWAAACVDMLIEKLS